MENIMITDIFQRILRRIAFTAPGGYSIRPSIHRLRGVKIGNDVWISQYVYIDELHPESISIGDNTTIGIGTSIISHFYWGPKKKDFKGNVVIGRDVFIGPHCVILPNVTIGDCSVIQAGTVVSRDVPSGTLWGAAKSKAIAKVTTPLTHHFSYSKFIRGLKSLHQNDNADGDDISS
jgi:acetyltransferase-like isoleucine patch superfamily enzyme